MWQLFALGSLVAYAFEGVIDKVAIVDDRRIDSVVATFWRHGWFVVVLFCVGLFGWAGHVQPVFPPLLIPLALMGIASGLSFTYVLRRVEITGIGMLGYLVPILFLFIDIQGLQTHFSLFQITGVVLLVLGGIGFVVDGKTHHLKKEFSVLVWIALLTQLLFAGVEAYSFKYLHATQGLNSMTFFLDLIMLISLGLLLVAVLQGKARLLFSKPAGMYVPRIVLSKICDAGGTLLWAQALTIAAVSQVAAMESLQLVILFGVAFVAQTLFGYHVRERFARENLRLKLLSVAILALGGFLVS